MLLLIGAAVCGAQDRSDWERRNIRPEHSEERPPSPPAYPRTETLIEFPVSGGTDFRFFIDRATLSAGNDGIVRYVLVARAPTGVENVSFEGMRCSGEVRTYALGRPDGTWTAVASGWRPLQRWQRALHADYFCPQTQPIRSAAEGVQALEQGGHPFARSFGAGNAAGR